MTVKSRGSTFREVRSKLRVGLGRRAREALLFLHVSLFFHALPELCRWGAQFFVTAVSVGVGLV